MLMLMLSVFPLAVALAPGAGCQSDAAELCDLRCECQPCNDREEDECVISSEADAERATNYECEPEYDSWIECALNNNSCDEGDNDFDIDEDCNDDRADLEECIADNSDLNSSQAGPGPTGPTDGPGPTGQGGFNQTSTAQGGFGGQAVTTGAGAQGGVSGVGGAGGVMP
jgi:hypothetical protein